MEPNGYGSNFNFIHYAILFVTASGPNGPNTTHYSNNHYDHLYEKAVSDNRISERLTLYHQMNQMIVHDAVIVPLYYDVAVRFYPENIRGFEGNPLNVLKLKYVYKIK